MQSNTNTCKTLTDFFEVVIFFFVENIEVGTLVQIKYFITLFFEFFFFRIVTIFNTHTEKDDKVFFKETYSGVYPKGPIFFELIIKFVPNNFSRTIFSCKHLCIDLKSEKAM